MSSLKKTLGVAAVLADIMLMNTGCFSGVIDLDDDFTQNLKSIIHLPMPRPKERLLLWRQEFSAKADLEEIIEFLKTISDRGDAGGQAEQAHARVQVARAEAFPHAQGASQEDQSADHHERAHDETGQRGGPGPGLELAAGEGQVDAA